MCGVQYVVLSWSAGFVGVRFATGYAPIFLILLWRSLVSGLDLQVALQIHLLNSEVLHPHPHWLNCSADYLLQRSRVSKKPHR